MGRIKAEVHRYFTVSTKDGRSYSNCIGCGHRVSTHVVRLRSHMNKCTELHATTVWQRAQARSGTLTQFAQTGKRDEDHLTIARAMISSNIPFSWIENPAVQEMFASLCPGRINPPSSSKLFLNWSKSSTARSSAW